jgi:AcrR family transcriptional regulator
VNSSTTKEELVKDFRTREILGAARSVIAELGVREASMERIAQAAGISKGTIYLYFENKEELLGRAVEHGFAELMDRLRSAVEIETTAVDQLAALARASLEHAGDARAFFRALIEPGSLGPESFSLLATRFTQQSEDYIDFVSGVIQRGIASGEFRGVSPRGVASLISGSLRAAVLETMARTSPGSLDHETKEIVDFWLNGVIARP